jgi:type II secretory ATPase GspE/PulE/Tfp pilus assembly ATPase PilB-like protein
VQRPATRAADGRRPELNLLDGLRAVPPGVARRHKVIPLRYEGDRLVVGAIDPGNLAALDALRRLGHARIEFEPLLPERYREVVQRWYGPVGDVAEFAARLPARLDPGEPSFGFEDPDDEAPAARFLALTLTAALSENASDVHLEPDRIAPRVRFRVDGVLVDRVAPPPWLADRVIGRVKSMAGLALGECLFAQDGQLSFPTPTGAVSIRVSIVPSDRGECAVLRLLTVENDIPTLEQLGMPPAIRRQLVEAAAGQEGLIVFAGPTGSGKTTSLHALLETVDADRRNIVSIEEPVEIHSRRVRQVPVRRETGLDFASALRFVLRQDPDVILVGETRDSETVELVLQASLAGHLVLTTVHASSALGVFDRFAQLGADRRLLAQVTRLAVSQRLIRLICPNCAGKACFACDGTGLKGRTGVFELVTIGNELAELVRQGARPNQLKAAARAAGMRTLEESAAELERNGATTAAEIDRVLDLQGRSGGSGGDL